MRHIFLFALILAGAACGPDTVVMPEARSVEAHSPEEAKKIAREVSSQKCKFAGFRSIGYEDVGDYIYECDHGVYKFEVGMSHQYEFIFGAPKPGQEVKLEYSDVYMMKPVYIGAAQDQRSNPAYYLIPRK